MPKPDDLATCFLKASEDLAPVADGEGPLAEFSAQMITDLDAMRRVYQDVQKKEDAPSSLNLSDEYLLERSKRLDDYKKWLYPDGTVDPNRLKEDQESQAAAEEELRAANAEIVEQRRKANEQHEEEVARIQAEGAERIEQLQAQHAKEVEELRAAYAREITHAETAQKEEVEHLETTVGEMRQQLAVHERLARLFELPKPSERTFPGKKKIDPMIFLEQDYGEEIRAGRFFQSDLREVDPGLFRSVRNAHYSSPAGRESEIGDIIPPLRRLLDSLTADEMKGLRRLAGALRDQGRAQKEENSGS